MGLWSKLSVALVAIVSALLSAKAGAFFWGPEYGQASCEASRAGHCAWVNDRTFLYRGTMLDIVYYAPSGRYYSMGSTEVARGRWWVDEAGDNIIHRMFGPGQFPPQPMAEFLARASDSVDGDPAALSQNKRGIYLLPLRDLPTGEIIERVRAR